MVDFLFAILSRRIRLLGVHRGALRSVGEAGAMSGALLMLRKS
jgi:hypothetical protein